MISRYIGNVLGWIVLGMIVMLPLAIIAVVTNHPGTFLIIVFVGTGVCQHFWRRAVKAHRDSLESGQHNP